MSTADSLALIHIKRGAYGSVSPGRASVAAVAVLLPYLVVMAGLVAGLARLQPTRPVLLLLLFLAYYTALHIVTHGFARYRLPIMPIVFLVAASAWCARGAEPLQGRRRVVALALAALTALVLVPSLRMNLGHPAFALQDEDSP